MSMMTSHALKETLIFLQVKNIIGSLMMPEWQLNTGLLEKLVKNI